MAHHLAAMNFNNPCSDISLKDNSQTRDISIERRTRHTSVTLCNIQTDKWRRSALSNFPVRIFNFNFLAALCLLALTFSATTVDACNESICASIVSKCTLLRSCDCEIEPTGCSCCKKCFACLDFLQVECCSCVGLCPMPNATLSAGAPQKSVVADFDDSMPQLWDALTDGEDLQERWQKYTYPVDVKSQPNSKKEDLDPASVQETVLKNEAITHNCTVVFLSQCMAEKKCEISCRSMGASAYRWFTDGCCECVGQSCVSYGINESRCEMCSYDDDDDQLLPENISDEELERLEKIENLANGESGDVTVPGHETSQLEPTPKKSLKKSTSDN